MYALVEHMARIDTRGEGCLSRPQSERGLPSNTVVAVRRRLGVRLRHARVVMIIACHQEVVIVIVGYFYLSNLYRDRLSRLPANSAPSAGVMSQASKSVRDGASVKRVGVVDACIMVGSHSRVTTRRGHTSFVTALPPRLAPKIYTMSSRVSALKAARTLISCSQCTTIRNAAPSLLALRVCTSSGQGRSQ